MMTRRSTSPPLPSGSDHSESMRARAGSDSESGDSYGSSLNIVAARATVPTSTLFCVQDVSALGKRVYSFKEFIDLGKAHPAEPVPPQAHDLCTIMYTSGTTGDPKVFSTTSKFARSIAEQSTIEK